MGPGGRAVHGPHGWCGLGATDGAATTGTVHSTRVRPQGATVRPRAPGCGGTVCLPAEVPPGRSAEVPVQEAHITVSGNVGGVPRTRVVASGSVVTDFRIAHTPRRQDRATGVWTDLPTVWFSVSCWRSLAENVAASLKTGDRVVVSGRLRAHTWKNEQGEERSGLEIDAQTVGVDLSRGKAVLERTSPMAATVDPGQRPDEEPDEDETSLGAPGVLAA